MIISSISLQNLQVRTLSVCHQFLHSSQRSGLSFGGMTLTDDSHGVLSCLRAKPLLPTPSKDLPIDQQRPRSPNSKKVQVWKIFSAMKIIEMSCYD